MSTTEFSLEDLRNLAAVEREMDAGTVQWVRVDGVSGRAAVSSQIMTMLDLRLGQTVSFTLWGEILRLSLRHCEEALAREVNANMDKLESELSEESANANRPD